MFKSGDQSLSPPLFLLVTPATLPAAPFQPPPTHTQPPFLEGVLSLTMQKHLFSRPNNCTHLRDYKGSFATGHHPPLLDLG